MRIYIQDNEKFISGYISVVPQWCSHWYTASLPSSNHGYPSASMPDLIVDFILGSHLLRVQRCYGCAMSGRYHSPLPTPVPRSSDISTLLPQCFLSLKKDDIDVTHFQHEAILFHILSPFLFKVGIYFLLVNYL